MNRFRILALGALLIAVFVWLWPYFPSRDFKKIQELNGITEYELKSNGLRVLTAHAPFPGLAAVASIYRSGAAQDEPQRAGTAHFLEHLTFRGTKKFNEASGTSIPDSLHRAGALINAQTSSDVTTYYEIIPTEHVELALEIESERMRHVLFSDEAIEREIDIITSEYNILTNNAKMELEKTVWNAAFKNHPYRYAIIGYPESIENMDTGTLKRYYGRHYQPNNLTIAVIGDFDESQILSFIQKYYGSVPRTHTASNLQAEPPQTRENRVAIQKSGNEKRLYIAQKSPEGTHPDIPALHLMSRILAGGTSSRLHQQLVQTGMALEIESETSELREPGLFIMSLRLGPYATCESVEKMILQTYQNLKRSGVTADELEIAKRQAISDRLFAQDSPFDFISQMINAVGSGDWANYFSNTNKMESVTTDDILRVANQYLIPGQTTIGCLTPATETDSTVEKSQSAPPVVDELSKETETSGKKTKQQKHYAQALRREPIASPQTYTIHNATVILAETGVRGIAHAAGSIAGAGRFYSPNPVLAELTALLLSENTEGFEPGGLSKALERMGSKISFGVDSEAFTFEAKFLTAETEKTFELMFEQLRKPSFRPEDFSRVKSQLKTSLINEKSSAATQAAAALMRMIYPRSYPLHETALQEKLDWLEKATLNDVRKFHAEHFGRNQLNIVVAGDLDSKKIKETIQKSLRDWPNTSNKISPSKLDFPESQAEQALIVPESADTALAFGAGVPITRAHADFPALQVANFILGGSSSSLLFQKIRQELGLAYQIRSSLAGFDRRLNGYWKISAAVRPEKKQEAVRAIRDVLNQFSKDEIPEADLAGKKTEIIGLYRIGLASSSGMADQILTLHEAGIPLKELEGFIQKIERLKTKDVRQVIARYLDSAKLQIATAGKD